MEEVLSQRVKILSNILINEIKPRMERGGKFVNYKFLAYLVYLKHTGRLSHRELRIILEAEMFKENHSKSLKEIQLLVR